MKVALFDFCETLVNFQTADYFVEYTLKKYQQNRFYQCLVDNRNIDLFLAKHWMFRKKLHLYQMKGLTKKQIDFAAEEFYQKYIVPNQFPSMNNLIREYKERDYEVYIVSGGYEPYIRYYALENNIDGIIANEFLYNTKNIFSGLLTQKDCMGKEKVIRLNQVFNRVQIEKSVSYSDSLSDLPILKWADKGVLVSKYKERKSAKENYLEQIVLSFLEENQKVKFEFEGIID